MKNEVGKKENFIVWDVKKIDGNFHELRGLIYCRRYGESAA